MFINLGSPHGEGGVEKPSCPGFHEQLEWKLGWEMGSPREGDALTCP